MSNWHQVLAINTNGSRQLFHRNLWRGISLWHLSTALASATCALSTSAYAQDANAGAAPQFDEIIVTARRTEERIQDVPVAITALSGNDLAVRGVSNVSDIAANVPGVFSAPGSARGSSAPVFGIRGQLNREPNATNDPSIGIYFAEVPWARPNGVTSGFVDLQSVQVLKGPQGTLFGRNSTAGAILITPNAPRDIFEGYVKVGAGDLGLFTTEGVINVPLGDTLAVRLVGSREKRDGYMTDVISGKTTNDINNYNFRGSIRWAPTDSFSSTTIVSYFKSNTSGDASKLFALAPAPPSPPIAGLFPRLQHALATTQSLGRYEFLSSFNEQTAAGLINGVPQVFLTEQYARNKTFTLQNTSQLELGDGGLFGGATIKNIAAARHVLSDTTFETVPVPFLTIHARGDFDMWQYSEELQLQRSGDKLEYVLGLFYFYESGSDKSFSYVVRPQFSLLDNRVENTSYSAFAHFSYDVTEKLGLTAGGRLTHDKRYIDFQNRNQTTPGVSAHPLYLCPLQPELGPNDGSLCHFEKTVSFTEPTWNLGVNYRLSDRAMVYASVARGYRSGGFTQGAVAVASTIPFLPEKALNFELGLKSDFDVGGMATRLNLAGYYTDYKDLQRTTNNLAVGSGGIVNTTFNAAKAHIWGAEADLSVRPYRNLELSLSYAYTAPRYDRFNDVYRDPMSGNTFTVDISDSTFILNSKHSLSANASYTLPLPERLGKPVISASYYYRSSFFVTNDINTPNCKVPGDPNPNAFYTNCYLNGGKLPGYSIVNGRIDWRNFLGLDMDLAVFVKNATNKYYFANGLNALAATGTLAVQPAPPRTFGVEARVPFGAMRY